MLIIGIDPGISGAICFFENGELKEVIDMPTMASGNKNKQQINGSQIFNEISLRAKKHKSENINVIVEQVSAMPGQV
jgi:crossover junction endodeoxyribonuclease RuvC